MEHTAPERLETIGDPAAVGFWNPVLTQEDVDAGKVLPKKVTAKGKSSAKKSRKSKSRRQPSKQAGQSSGILFHLLEARGLIREQLEPGKWSITCPLEHEHSTDDPDGTSIVLFAPNEGDIWGCIKDLHTGHGHDQYQLQDWLRALGATESEIAAARKACGARPVIRISSELHKVVDEAAELLSEDPDIYQRNGELVHVVRIAKNQVESLLLEGTPIVHPITAAALTDKLTKLAEWQKFDGRSQTWVQTLPTRSIVEALLARKQWRAVSPLTGITESPIFHSDGEIVQTPGYHVATGFLYIPTCDFPDVPDAPTTEDVSAAAELLREPFSEFSWRSEPDMSVLIALVFTGLAKASIADSPAFAVDATTKGSGKGLAVDAAKTITTGRAASKLTYSPDPAELEKILGGMALQGSSYVTFDDVVDPIGGPPICNRLTSKGFSTIRVLGKSETPELPWTAIFTFTGNQVELYGDISRRILVARLEPEVENPELRTGWKHDPLLKWVEDNRPELVCAALTILRAWHLDGRKSYGCGTLGSFETWASIIPPALVFGGFADPLACCPSNQAVTDEPPEKAAMRTVLEKWNDVAGKDGSTIARVLAKLWPKEIIGECHDGLDGLRGALCVLVDPPYVGCGPDAKKLGKYFSRQEGTIYGGKYITGKGERASGGLLRWRVVTRTLD